MANRKPQVLVTYNLGGGAINEFIDGANHWRVDGGNLSVGYSTPAGTTPERYEQLATFNTWNFVKKVNHEITGN